MGWFVKKSPAMDFMHKLGTDSSALADFKADPEGAMSRAGLSDADKKVIRTRDKEHLIGSLLGHTSDT